MDYAASTPIDPEVLAAMMPWLSHQHVGNASSVQNMHGQTAKRAIERAKAQIAAAIGADSPDEIILTSGATESNNLALGSLTATHCVTSATEHKAVLNPIHTFGHTISHSPLLPCGMADGKDILSCVTDETQLISIMAVNNETGVINPLSEIRSGLNAKGVDKKQIIIHCDAAQALGKIKLNVNEMGVDMMTLSGHKAYAPQGIGALYVRKSVQHLLRPLMQGGGQQNNIRSGTLPTALIVGLGHACMMADAGLTQENTRMNMYHNMLRAMLDQATIDYKINGHDHGDDSKNWRVPHIINLRFAGIKSEWLLEAVQDISFSTGSACHANGTNTPSHVLKAMGLTDDEASESIRISFGRFTTPNDIKQTAHSLINAVALLDEMRHVA